MNRLPASRQLLNPFPRSHHPIRSFPRPSSSRLYSTPPPRSSPRPTAAQRKQNRSLLLYGAATVVLAGAATYLAVPLYRAFCSATGYAGTPRTDARFDAERLSPDPKSDKRVRVRFNADASDSLPWSFTPQQKEVSVLPGETALAFYTATNNSDEPIVGIATYNVTPNNVSSFSGVTLLANLEQFGGGALVASFGQLGHRAHTHTLADRTVLCQGRVLLLRRATNPRTRGSRPPHLLLHRPRLPRRSAHEGRTRSHLVLHFFVSLRLLLINDSSLKLTPLPVLLSPTQPSSARWLRESRAGRGAFSGRWIYACSIVGDKLHTDSYTTMQLDR